MSYAISRENTRPIMPCYIRTRDPHKNKRSIMRYVNLVQPNEFKDQYYLDKQDGRVQPNTMIYCNACYCGVRFRNIEKHLKSKSHNDIVND